MSLRRRDAHGRLGVLSRQGLVSCGTQRELIAGSMPAINSAILPPSGLTRRSRPRSLGAARLPFQFGLFQRITFLFGSPPGA